MNEFNFRVANAAPRASGFEIGQNVGDTKTTYIYSYKTKYINGKSTGQKTNVDWYMESEGVRVNLRNGSTEIAYPGDRISAYRFTNQTWQLRSTFLLPSSDQIITL